MNKLKTLFLSIIIALAVATITFAWTNPTGNPPSGGGVLYYSGGNVGIGTSTPTAKLQIGGTPGVDGIKFPDGTLQTTAAMPTGAISAFYLASCPTGWILANGTGGTPDLRGVFIRGLDLGRGIDPGRVLGTLQEDELKAHSHSLSYAAWIEGGAGYHNAPTAGDYGAILATANTGGSETRPKNVALIYCMKQ